MNIVDYIPCYIVTLRNHFNFEFVSYTKLDLKKYSIENVSSLVIYNKSIARYIFTFQNKKPISVWGKDTVHVHPHYGRASVRAYGISLYDIVEEDIPWIKEWL